MPRKPIKITVEIVNQPTQETKDMWNRMLVDNYLKQIEEQGKDPYKELDMLEKAIKRI